MKLRFYLSVIILAFLFMFTSSAYCEKEVDSIEGTWIGKGYQDNGSTWTIALVAKKGVFNISYPSLNCGGFWSIEKADSNRTWFIETITYGKGNCISNGRIVITLINEKYITYTWFYPNGKLGAYPTLVKK